MSVLVDTNVLLRRTQPAHESHAVAVESVARLLATGEPGHFTLQNIAEFCDVVTRPVALNGLEAERLGGLQIHHQLEFGRLLDRQIGGLGALQDAIDIGGRAAEQVVLIDAAGHQ
jgi:predicted nucleic acid-binding protein